ncbi:MAG TPA: hypothetical protein VJJ46_01715 [Anaerolineales bacterium]|nr:hypothetical protein [Anaerolineales bacterium]
MATRLRAQPYGLALACALLLAACASAPPAVDSGIEGTVWIGPMCPVVIAGTECPDQPYQAELEVLAADGAVLATVESDGRGRYRVGLPAGEYTLVPLSPAAGIPSASPIPFTVMPGEWTRLDVHYDSGIR